MSVTYVKSYAYLSQLIIFLSHVFKFDQKEIIDKIIILIILGIDMMHEIMLYNDNFHVKIRGNGKIHAKIRGNAECMIMKSLLEVLKLVAKVIMTLKTNAC